MLLLAILSIFILRVFVADSSQALTWDVFGYYLYLPAFFIYDDPTLQQMQWVQHIIDTYQNTGTFYQAVQVESGNWVMRYPAGLSILNAPFFFVAHGLAEPLGYAADGFSKPYQMAWILGSFFYTIIGLWFARKLLLRYFSDAWTAALLFLLVFATNYIEQASYANPLAHNFLFTLFVLVLYLVDGWKAIISWKSTLLVGLLIGLITMCRPNEGLIVLIPLLWKLNPLKGFTTFKACFRIHFPPLLGLGAGMLLGGLAQMVYWKFASGHWLFYSYQDNAVGFDFTRPHTLDFLFSYRKGWYLYTPLMLLATIGFVSLYRRKRELFWPFFLFFILNLYVVSSWSCWWYAGGSYSSRSMVSTYLMMAFPLGYLLQDIRARWKGMKIPVALLLALLTLLNLFQFWQFRNGILDGERMTKAYYWKVFGRTSVPKGARDLLLVERQATAYEKMPSDTSHLKRSILFESWLGTDSIQTNQQMIAWPDESYERVAQLDSANIYTVPFEVAMEDVTKKEYAWLRISAEIYVPEGPGTEMPLLVTHFNYKEKPYKYTTTENQVPNLKKGEWQRVTLDYMTPEVRTSDDKLKVYLWYRGKGPVYARSLEIIRYEPKRSR